jgi:hypothetical protein
MRKFTDRDMQIVAKVYRGEKPENVAQEFGISLTRVRQIVQKHGISQASRRLRKGLDLRAWRQLSEADALTPYTARPIEPALAQNDEEKFANILIMLSTRARSGLKREGITTLEMLRSRSPAEFLRIDNFGRKSLNELADAMAIHGVAMALSPYDADPGLCRPAIPDEFDEFRGTPEYAEWRAAVKEWQDLFEVRRRVQAVLSRCNAARKVLKEKEGYTKNIAALKQRGYGAWRNLHVSQLPDYLPTETARLLNFANGPINLGQIADSSQEQILGIPGFTEANLKEVLLLLWYLEGADSNYVQRVRGKAA